MASNHYALGDNRLAGDRLALLAEVFGPTSAALIAAHAPPSPALAVDLGCGPGHTTRLLSRVSGAAETVGLDASADFVARAETETAEAEAQEAPGERGGVVRFLRHDLTMTPWPVLPPELAFARYLLAHLPDPLAVVARWGTQLAPGGVLLSDEAERIDTDEAAFATYLRISGAMIAHHGAELYVGRVLAVADGFAGLEVVASTPVSIAPPTAVVARIFAMNLATWRHDPYVVSEVDPAEIDALAADLDRLSSSPATGAITWTHRQVALRRPAT